MFRGPPGPRTRGRGCSPQSDQHASCSKFVIERLDDRFRGDPLTGLNGTDQGLGRMDLLAQGPMGMSVRTAELAQLSTEAVCRGEIRRERSQRLRHNDHSLHRYPRRVRALRFATPGAALDCGSPVSARNSTALARAAGMPAVLWYSASGSAEDHQDGGEREERNRERRDGAADGPSAPSPARSAPDEPYAGGVHDRRAQAPGRETGTEMKTGAVVERCEPGRGGPDDQEPSEQHQLLAVGRHRAPIGRRSARPVPPRHRTPAARSARRHRLRRPHAVSSRDGLPVTGAPRTIDPRHRRVLER